MEKKLREFMQSKSKGELEEHFKNPDFYEPEVIMAAIAELKNRGYQFTDNELESVKTIVKQKLETKSTEHIPDERLPRYYSRFAITGFSFFFTPIFGAILYATNISGWKEKFIVIVFGFLYTMFAFYLIEEISVPEVLLLLMNVAGAFIITTLFWNKHIGSQTKYKAKPVWKPIIIFFVVTFLLMVLIGLLADFVDADFE